MEKRTDKNSYTVIFAVGMVIVVGALLAFLASYLKPTITENRRLEKQQNILYVLGVNENDESSAVFISTDKAPEAFTDNVKEQIVLTIDANGKITDTQMNRVLYTCSCFRRNKLPVFIFKWQRFSRFAVKLH